jgi:beta-1,4-mannooligosaccharide/beta-1,4-mannosyl-N-acetylglucosamine phosphorylase
MAKLQILCPAVPNLPWQARPVAGVVNSPLWRWEGNPVIGRNPLPGVARIFNSAVLPYQGKYIGVFRGEQVNSVPHIYLGESEDGLAWTFAPNKIPFVDQAGQPFMPLYAYDPRLVEVEGVYYAIWCQDFYGAAIGMARTTDFKTFTRLENPFLPYNRNAVLFPRKVNGRFLLLSRPSDSGHTPFGDIFISESSDLVYWGRHRHVMSKGSIWWESLKIGGGPAPIETSEGWLLLYHGVCNTCNGYVYSFGGALLDLDNPAQVRYRCENYLMTPEVWYEEQGYVPNVVFPCAALCDSATGRLAIYYGAADSYVGLAFGYLEEIVDYIKAHSVLTDSDRETGQR